MAHRADALIALTGLAGGTWCHRGRRTTWDRRCHVIGNGGEFWRIFTVIQASDHVVLRDAGRETGNGKQKGNYFHGSPEWPRTGAFVKTKAHVHQSRCKAPNRILFASQCRCLASLPGGGSHPEPCDRAAIGLGSEDEPHTSFRRWKPGSQGPTIVGEHFDHVPISP